MRFEIKKFNIFKSEKIYLYISSNQRQHG